MHLVNAESLVDCYHRLDGRKAVGIDGVTKAQYGEELGLNLEALVERMQRLAYRPGPVRQVLIPKDGKPDAWRPLGISNFEDKLVQGAMSKVLESIYEPIFKDCSYREISIVPAFATLPADTYLEPASESGVLAYSDVPYPGTGFCGRAAV